MDQLDQLDVFISYARMDGAEYAARFYKKLLSHPSHRFAPWYDRLIALEDFDRVIDEKLATADVLLVVLTRGSPDRDWCRDEIIMARKRNIQILVAKMHDQVADQVALVRKRVVDFAALGEAAAWSEMMQLLIGYAAPERVADSIQAALAEAAADDDPDDPRQDRFRRDQQERRGEEHHRTAEAPAAHVPAAGIGEALQRELEPVDPVRIGTHMRLVNDLPVVAQTQFRDHVRTLRQVDEALGGQAARLIVLTGADGVGKTAMVGEIRQRLVDRRFQSRVDGFAYLAAGGYRPVSAGALMQDLSRLVDDKQLMERLDDLLRQPVPGPRKLQAVLDALGDTPVVLAIDDFDELLDANGQLHDRELRDLIRALCGNTGHGLRLLLVSERTPDSLINDNESQVRVCSISDGLPPGETLPFLQALDEANVLRWHEVPMEQVDRVSEVSNGNPRFLELLYCLMRIDPEPSLVSVLDDIAPAGAAAKPTEYIAALVRRIIGRLDRTQRRVLQGLAVYGRPVLPEAVDFLLADYVVGVESEPILRRMDEQRLIRRDGDRFFLPPSPDAHLIRATVPAGSDEDWDVEPVPYTLPFLRHRAADYFAAVRGMRATVANLGDLRLEFSEVELRIAAGGYKQAISLMERVDEDYLTRWGQSGALAAWRHQIRGRIGNSRLEAHNLSFLAFALDEDEDQAESMIAALEGAIRQPWARRAPRDRVRLAVQLADKYAETGRLGLAARRHRLAALQCRIRSMHFEEASARNSQGLSLARLGQFGPARRAFTRAYRLVGSLRGQHHDEVIAINMLNQGWMYGQIGERTKALRLLEEGLAVATAMGDVVLEGKLLDGTAALLCDSDEPERALQPAERAAEIGIRTPHPSLCRRANVTLAFAYLRVGELSKAASAAQAAVRLPTGPPALSAWVAHGVVLFRRGEDDGARNAFHAACTEAWLRINREPGEYQAHDMAGLALCGLAACGEPERLRYSVEAYRRARRIAPVAGARRRNVLHLQLLGGRADPQIVAEASRAAGDDDGERARLRP